MVVPPKTPRVTIIYLNVADVARRMKKSRWAALRAFEKYGLQMGAEMVPDYSGSRRARWRCDAAQFETWLKARGLAA